MPSSDTPAPGLKTRKRANGVFAYYWVAANCSRRTDNYPSKTVRLKNQSPDGAEERASQCQHLHMELQLWLEGKTPEQEFGRIDFDGSVASLIRFYRDHPQSPYRKLKYNTQKIYDQHLNILRDVVGKRRLSTLGGVDFLAWYDKFALDDHGESTLISTAHKLMNMFRITVSWGVVLELPHAPRVRDILSEMRFAKPEARKTFLSYDQALAVIEKAHEQGMPSIALAQALQFELTMRQKDVIGEYFPKGSPVESTIFNNGKRWANGLMWSHLGADGVLRKETTKTGAEAVFELARYPLIVQEIARWRGPKEGPMIVDERSGLPYLNQRFSKRWRDIATLAGVPKGVYNMDSRAGGVTEATDAGAPLEMVRHHATHRDARTTARYSRQTLAKTQAVADFRTASRNKAKT
jgi:hypothetical protein